MPGGKYTEPKLKNAINIESQNIKNSIAIMSKASFGVTYEGLVTHILSGFNIPVVNIQGVMAKSRFEKDVGEAALRNYEIQNQLEQGTATMDQIIESTRGLYGWAYWATYETWDGKCQKKEGSEPTTEDYLDLGQVGSEDGCKAECDKRAGQSGWV